jgi:hypothetical protein
MLDFRTIVTKHASYLNFVNCDSTDENNVSHANPSIQPRCKICYSLSCSAILF